MPIADVDNVLLLIQRIGDVDPISAEPVYPLSAGSNGIVMLNADRIWDKYVSYKSIQPPSIGSEIFDHLFMITGQQLVTAVLAERITFSAVGTAVRVQLSDRWAHHKAQMDDLRKELERLRIISAAWGTAAIGPILAVEPIRPPVPGEIPSPLWAVGQADPFVIDGNSPALTGSPYWSQWRRYYP